MLVTPLPGTDRENVLKALELVHMAAQNARGASGNVIERHEGYLKWVDDAVYALRGQISSADVDRLVLTRRYWMLQPLTTEHLVQGPLNRVISTELDERVIALDAAVTALRAQIARWCRPGRFVIPDTSLFIEHPDRIEAMDLRPLLGIRDEPVHLLLPIVVIDELDNLKQTNGTHERWRARQALRIIDDRLTNPLEPAELQPEDYTSLDNGGIPRGQVTMEIVFDPPGHVRLPIADDEIVDCALRVKALAGRQVTVITYDTRMSTRARAAGIKVAKIAYDEAKDPRKKKHATT